MRQLIAAAFLVTALVAPGPSSTLHAAPGDPTESPSQQLMASPRPGASDVGWIWTVGTNPAATHLMRRVGLRDGSYQTWIECDSVDDPDCAPVDQAALSGQIVIGHCASDTEIGCVDALAIDGVELTPSGHIGDDNVLPEDTERGIPRGASHPMWTASDGSIYILANKIEYEYAAVDGEWQASPATIEFSLRRAAAGSTPVAPRAWLRSDSPDPSLSILALDDMDIDEIELDPTDMIELELRLPASISGWFHGRLDAAAVSQIASNDDVITYAIAARPMEVQVAGGWFDPADLSAAGREQLYGPRIPTPGEVGVGGAGDPGSSLSQFRVLEPLLGQQAFTEIVQWAFRSASSGDGPTCGQDVPGLTGIISSNAAVYDGRLPSWNPETETLEIEIGSPHLASDGTEAVGSYTASLPDDLVDCLWELGTAPAIAELDVGYDDESVTSGGALTSADGWVNVDVEGFHYSTPSVGLRLSEREPSGGAFESLTPSRILDTRGSDPVGELDGSGDAYVLQVTGVGGVPSSATAVALNVTVVDGEANDFGGFVTVFPCGTRPDASNLNFVSGQTVPNSVIAPLSADGEVCLYVYGQADLLVDVSGYFVSGFEPLTPDRILDTRGSDPVGELDGSGDAYTLQVTGGDVPASATAVALNVTVVNGEANDFGGFVTVFPCGTRPDASNLNFVSGQTVPNSVIAPLSASGTVCLYVYGQADLLVDVSGYFTSGFTPQVPDRILDTRSSDPVGELDGSGDAYTLQVTGGDVPSSATAVALNVTVVDGQANDFGGFVTVFPCGTRPDASNLNFVSGQTVPNSVVAPLSSSGTVCLYVYGQADLLVDVSGHL